MEVSNKQLQKLNDIYFEHGSLIIGVDFDDTIFALDPQREVICNSIRKLIKECKVHSEICLYTVASNQDIKYKIELMKLWGIEPNYVNESSVKLGNGAKPFFNILLDDKAGLIESYNLLKKFNDNL